MRQKIQPDPDCLLEAHEVTMKFTRYDVGVNSLKELVVRAFRRDLKREKFVCLENVSFKIHKGEAVAVIGRNGVGKSTLLKIVSGILKPTSGWAHCNGRISPLLQLGAGFDGNATGIENIYLNAAIMGYTKKEIDAKLPEILAFAELGDFIHTPSRRTLRVCWRGSAFPSRSRWRRRSCSSTRSSPWGTSPSKRSATTASPNCAKRG